MDYFSLSTNVNLHLRLDEKEKNNESKQIHSVVINHSNSVDGINFDPICDSL